MIFKAVVSSKAHPDYGAVSIPFPIPDSEYDYTIGILEDMGIGDTLAQDCQVDEIASGYPILNRLVGQGTNVDELDYLAKRLEGFCPSETAQFQAMASKLCLSNIKDLINLTFCCQQATVITDFSSLEQVSKDHSLTINGGSMPTGAVQWERLCGTQSRTDPGFRPVGGSHQRRWAGPSAPPPPAFSTLWHPAC